MRSVGSRWKEVDDQILRRSVPIPTYNVYLHFTCGARVHNCRELCALNHRPCKSHTTFTYKLKPTPNIKLSIASDQLSNPLWRIPLFLIDLLVWRSFVMQMPSNYPLSIDDLVLASIDDAVYAQSLMTYACTIRNTGCHPSKIC